MKQKISDEELLLLQQLKRVKAEISKLGEMRPGSISEQYNVCGQKDCCCKDKENPQKHGPYYQLSYTRKGRSTSEFVRVEDVKIVRRQLADYKKFGELKDEWTGISIDLARLRRENRKAKTV